jgi:hypothetical protein
MAGKRKTNEAGSTNGLRGDVLRVLGVLKVATADQIQRLSSPHLTYRHPLKTTASQRKEARTASHRGAANDLRRHGLSVDVGRTRGGEEVRLLTAAGLASAIYLGREPEEIGSSPSRWTVISSSITFPPCPMLSTSPAGRAGCHGQRRGVARARLASSPRAHSDGPHRWLA